MPARQRALFLPNRGGRKPIWERLSIPPRPGFTQISGMNMEPQRPLINEDKLRACSQVTRIRKGRLTENVLCEQRRNLQWLPGKGGWRGH